MTVLSATLVCGHLEPESQAGWHTNAGLPYWGSAMLAVPPDFLLYKSHAESNSWPWFKTSVFIELGLNNMDAWLHMKATRYSSYPCVHRLAQGICPVLVQVASMISEPSLPARTQLCVTMGQESPAALWHPQYRLCKKEQLMDRCCWHRCCIFLILACSSSSAWCTQRLLNRQAPALL